MGGAIATRKKRTTQQKRGGQKRDLGGKREKGWYEGKNKMTKESGQHSQGY